MDTTDLKVDLTLVAGCVCLVCLVVLLSWFVLLVGVLRLVFYFGLVAGHFVPFVLSCWLCCLGCVALAGRGLFGGLVGCVLGCGLLVVFCFVFCCCVVLCLVGCAVLVFGCGCWPRLVWPVSCGSSNGSNGNCASTPIAVAIG